MKRISISVFALITLGLAILADDEFKHTTEEFSRDCPVCKWSFKQKRSADIPSKRFEGVFKKGEKCPFCKGAGRIVEKIDWTDGFYIAYGVGISFDKNHTHAKVKAIQAARRRAAANALKLATRIHFINLKQLRVANYTQKIEGIIKEAEYKTVKEPTNTTPVLAVVSVKVPLWGVKSLSAALFDDLQHRFAKLKKLKIIRIPPKKTTDVEITIIIDARTYKNAIKRSLFPTIRDKEGEYVYDITRVLKEYAVKKGMVKYVILSDNEEDFNHLKERLEKESRLPDEGENYRISKGWCYISNDGDEGEEKKPRKKKKKKRIVIKADENKFDDATVVISKEDAKKMKETDKEADSMKKGNVIIIVDSRVAGKEGRLHKLEKLLATLR